MRKTNWIPRLFSIGVVLLYSFHCPLAGQNVQKPPDTPVNPQPGTVVDPCLKSTCRDAPVRESLDTFDLPRRRFDVKWRGILGGFSQGAGIAGGVQATTAETIPHVQVRANFLTSTQLAQRFDLGAKFDVKGNKKHADIWASYVKRQTDFFGIGPQSSNAVRSSFGSIQRSYQASFYRDLAANLKAGVFGRVASTSTALGKSKKNVPMTDRFSGSPSAAPDQWIPGFLSTVSILSYGGFLEYDSRDRSKGLTRGIDIYLRGTSNDGIRSGNAFGDYGWVEGDVDVRGYFPLGSPQTSLALRSEGQYKKPKGSSQIPFYELSVLGGHDFVRGYDAYRFRGNNALINSAELRQTIYRKSDSRGVDVFGFADTGRLWGDSRSTVDPAVLANQSFKSSQWRTGVGGGLEYRHTGGIAVRAEVGHSKEGTLIYTSLARGF